MQKYYSFEERERKSEKKKTHFTNGSVTWIQKQEKGPKTNRRKKLVFSFLNTYYSGNWRKAILSLGIVYMHYTHTYIYASCNYYIMMKRLYWTGLILSTSVHYTKNSLQMKVECWYTPTLWCHTPSIMTGNIALFRESWWKNLLFFMRVGI